MTQLSPSVTLLWAVLAVLVGGLHRPIGRLFELIAGRLIGTRLPNLPPISI